VIGEKEADNDANNCIVAKQPIIKLQSDSGAMVDMR